MIDEDNSSNGKVTKVFKSRLLGRGAFGEVYLGSF